MNLKKFSVIIKVLSSGFPKRELRGKLAIGITANFVNQRTLAEEKVQEIRFYL